VLVAHCSDLHLLSLEGARLLDFLGKRLTGALNLVLNRGGEFPTDVALALIRDVNAEGADHLLVSGDLTNLALPSELALVRRVLEELRLPPSAVTVVPGNHDAYTEEVVRRKDFSRVMLPFLRGDLHAGPTSFPFVRLREELAVVALSSAVPTAPLLATGRIGAGQLAMLERLLGSEECRARFRLVVLHHPPHDRQVHWHNRLLDAGALRVVLARTGAELVVHGHQHRFLRLELEGPERPIPSIGVGSGTWLSPGDPERRAQYNLYRIEGRRLLEVRRRRYEPVGRRFEELGSSGTPCPA
jgi:3',5'-cyclic AMP phosphodiesterase CpdA